MTDRRHPVYTILDGIKGRGSYVGTYLAWTPLQSDWWGEVKFYLDGDTDQPSMADNGTSLFLLCCFMLCRTQTAHPARPFCAQKS